MDGIDNILQTLRYSRGREAHLIGVGQTDTFRENYCLRETRGKAFKMSNDGYRDVYTDGACASNGRNDARAGIGVYWGDNHPLNVSEPVSGRATNNCGEIQAATRAIQQAQEHGIDRITINTDSKFLIKSATEWMPGWKENGWRCSSGQPVKNEQDFRELDNAQRNSNVQVKWQHVGAHKGVHGNEMADQLAKAGASRYRRY